MQDDKLKAEATCQQDSSTGSTELNFVQVATIVYSVMTVLGLLIMKFGHNNLEQVFHWPSALKPRATILASALLVTGILLIATYLCESMFNAFRYLKYTVAFMLGKRSYAVSFYLALISSIGEELLFRGAVQPFTGLAFASVVFGLAHLGPEGLSLWTVWAFCAGLLLGWTFDATGSLWPPLIAHFLLNLISMLRLQYQVRRGQIVLPEIPAHQGH